ncbi:hypothetical protein [Polyangium aurulentum]|uniref:hypothetical protein n=1 Tax=Polyangium aurulentum TaxID=2567896 RepID=UPI0010AE8389|nr:hypothetical protein [Polyangium aurulentum]UQA59922.1 hypothetical protein E8A73_005365 [Polyangium aurulentum]
MRNIKVDLALGLAGAAALCVMFGSITPASADNVPPGVTFWSGAFTGQTVNYPDPSTSCTTLPFTVHAELNNTSKYIQVYTTTDCTGPALTIPPTDIHNFTSFDARSFRVTS